MGSRLPGNDGTAVGDITLILCQQLVVSPEKK